MKIKIVLKWDSMKILNNILFKEEIKRVIL